MPMIVFACQVMKCSLYQYLLGKLCSRIQKIYVDHAHSCVKHNMKSEGKFTEMMMVCKEWDSWVRGYDAFVVVVRSLLKGLGHRECVESASYSIDSTYTCQ